MKKIILLLFIVNSLFATIELTQKEKDFIQTNSNITLGGGISFAPYLIQNDDGTITGYDKDIIEIINKTTGLNIKFELGTWNNIQEKAKNRKLDGISTAIISEDRKKYYNASDAYIQLTSVVIVKEGNPNNIRSLKDVEGKKVAIQKGNILFTNIAKSLKDVDIIYYDSMTELIKSVISNEVDFTIFDDGVFYIAKEMGLERFIEYSFVVGDSQDIVFHFRNDYPELVSIVNKGLRAIKKETKLELKEKWFSNSQDNTFIYLLKQIDYEFVFKVLGGVFLLTLIIIYRQFELNRVNNKLESLVDEKTKELQDINQNLEQRIIEEVNKSKETEQKLFQAEKMISLGELIGNIAHQWRQPLSIISASASSMEVSKELDILSDKEFYTSCKAINSSAQYLSKTIDDFRHYIKKDKIETTFYLKKDIENFLSLVEPIIIENNIKVISSLDEKIQINGFENEFIHLLINIFNNSKDAFEANEIENKLIFISSSIENNNAVIKVKDNGGGIDRDNLSKIFEPYFTTKHKSVGTGLGLHFAYNIIVESMNGTIEVTNKKYIYEGIEYEGAELVVILPLK